MEYFISRKKRQIHGRQWHSLCMLLYCESTKHLFLLLIALLTFTSRSYAATLNFRNYTVKDGLASSTVYDIFQDSKGFIWLATESGVNRFDGQRFELFTMDDGLSDNEVLHIGEDSNGRIWFLSLNGKLSYYFNHRFHNTINNPLLRKSSYAGSFVSLFEDAAHNLWFTTNQNMVVRISKNNEVRFYTSSSGTLANCSVSQTERGDIIAFGKDNIFEFKGTHFAFLRAESYPVSPKSLLGRGSNICFLSEKGILVQYQNKQASQVARLQGLTNTSPATLLNDIHKQLWVATMGQGIFIYNHLNRKPVNYLKEHNITQLMKDSQGNIWISTIGKGIFMLPVYTAYTTHFTTEDGLSSNAVTSILKTKDQLILGLRCGNLDILSRQSIKHRIFNSPLLYNPVKRLYYDKARQSVWYASDLSLIEINNHRGDISILRDKGKSFALKSVSVSKTGEIAAALASGIFIINKDTHVEIGRKDKVITNPHFMSRAYSVYYDSDGRLWFSNIFGLHYFSNGKVTDLYKSYPALRQRITDISELSDKTIICTSYGFGVFLIKNGKLVRTITTATGLASNICRRVVVEKNKAWIVTGRGISALDFSTSANVVTNYNTENGLISDEVNDISVTNDSVYVATNNGVSVFKPAFRSLRKAPLLYLTKVRFNKRTLDQTEYTSLSSSQNNISVSYIALDYSYPNQVSYSYRLNPESRWNETQGSTIEFASLEPGNYQLTIRARSLNTRWSQPLKIHFIIHPPFWKTWWFNTLVIILLVSGSFLLIRNYFRARQAEEKEKLLTKTRIIALEQQALQAMMNPHFIFNVMNSIQYFINTKDNTMANQMLTGFARLIRKNLEICNKSYINIEEEVSYLSLYLSLEKLRFGEKLEYHIEIDEETDLQKTFIPSMLLQPFVENAIWHGIMPMDSPGLIQIDIQRKTDHLDIRISDNGVGIENSKKFKTGDHISRGMDLTSQRVKLLNKFKSRAISIDIRQAIQGGTIVSILIPLEPFTN